MLGSDSNIPNILAFSNSVWISARRRGKNRHPHYYLRWMDPQTGRERCKAAGTSRAYALACARQLQTELAAGVFRTFEPIGWSIFVQQHLNRIPEGENHRQAELILTEFTEVCAPARPDSITYSMLEDFAQHCRRAGNSAATRNKKFRYLRAAFIKAGQRNHLRTDPMQNWKWEREDRKAIRVLSPSEQAQLLASCPTHQWQVFVTLALRTGCRKGELLNLSWSHIDFERAIITVTHTKGKRDRTIPLPPSLINLLRRLRGQNNELSCCLFPWNGQSIIKVFHRIVRAAGIEPCTIHDLRRTFCTDLARAGVNQLVIGRLAGHADSKTTARYYQVVQEEALRDAILRIAPDEVTEEKTA
jgi:integrase